jgi:hypothetical protein
MQLDVDCPEQLHQLELLALTEAQELAQTAGGGMMQSKGGGPSWVVKGVLISSVVGAGIYAGHHEIQYRKAKKQFEAWKNEASSNFHHRENEFEGYVVEAEGKLYKDYAANPDAFYQKLTDADRRVWDGTKDISKYDPRDIETAAIRRTADRMAIYVSQDLELALVRKATTSKEFEAQVVNFSLKKYIARNPKVPGSSYSHTQARAEAKKKLMDGTDDENWLETTVAGYRRDGIHLELIAAERQKVYNACRNDVSAEFEAAKQKEMDRLMQPNYFDDVQQGVRRTERKIETKLDVIIEETDEELLMFEEEEKKIGKSVS